MDENESPSSSSSSSPIPSHEYIEEKYQHEISLLLAPPSPHKMQIYYDNLASKKRCKGLQVKYIGGQMGKGVFSQGLFKKDDLVLKEPMLVGGQHSHNKVDALVCSFCFCYIGSIEAQIARRFISEEMKVRDDVCDVNLDDCEERFNEGLDKSSNEEPMLTLKESSDSAEVLDSDTLAAMLNGKIKLPYSHLFPLPSIVNCIGGCTEYFYCSKKCAESAWELHHSILCTGPNSCCQNKEALKDFKHHANETNDIFHVAAQVIAATILKASSLGRLSIGGCVTEGQMEELMEAWEPFSMGHKDLWWDSVALPKDVDSSNGSEFRQQLKDLAAMSLSLLKKSIYEDKYAPLFSLSVYGHIIGMFEMNNLDLVVASPVEDYFIYIDDLAGAEKEEAEKITRPLLDALGDEYATPCQGTAFYPTQSCMNHSCSPNTKAFKRDEDKDGQAVLIALKSIKKGEEITISYIDEDLPWQERKAMLEDYGFECQCQRCLEERSQMS